MQPILFLLGGPSRNRPLLTLGMPPTMHGVRLSVLPSYLVISGITKDSTGAVLAGCTVFLFLTTTDVLVDKVVSDANGVYEFRTTGSAESYYVGAYKAGAPDVAGTTVNTLTGTGV